MIQTTKWFTPKKFLLQTVGKYVESMFGKKLTNKT